MTGCAGQGHSCADEMCSHKNKICFTKVNYNTGDMLQYSDLAEFTSEGDRAAFHELLSNLGESV